MAIEARTVMMLVVSSLALGGLVGSHTCSHDPNAQPVTPGLPSAALPGASRAMTQYDLINAAYQRQVERLWTLLYEGMITRPGREREEEEKFMRGLRIARTARERAQELVFREPWVAIPPIPGSGPGYLIEPSPPR